MKFLRATENKDQDLVNKVSYHLIGDLINLPENYDTSNCVQGNPWDDSDENWYEKLEGLCGLDVTDLASEDIRENIKRLENWFDGSSIYIFEGDFIEYCPDGDVFMPSGEVWEVNNNLNDEELELLCQD